MLELESVSSIQFYESYQMAMLQLIISVNLWLNNPFESQNVLVESQNILCGIIQVIKCKIVKYMQINTADCELWIM